MLLWLCLTPIPKPSIGYDPEPIPSTSLLTICFPKVKVIMWLWDSGTRRFANCGKTHKVCVSDMFKNDHGYHPARVPTVLVKVRSLLPVKRLATGCTTEGSEFESRHRQEFSLLHIVQNGSGAHPASYPMGLSSGVKHQWREADHSSPTSAEVMQRPVPSSSLPISLFTNYPNLRLHYWQHREIHNKWN
jgi:hypothetical protein